MGDNFLKEKIHPPHQSLTRQLPPEGKPFCFPFCGAIHNKSLKHCGLLPPITRYHTPSEKGFSARRLNCFLMICTVYGRLPRGGKLSRQRLMRGDNDYPFLFKRFCFDDVSFTLYHYTANGTENQERGAFSSEIFPSPERIPSATVCASC